MSQNKQMYIQEQETTKEKRPVVHVGIDVHKAQWTIFIFVNRMPFKKAMTIDPDPVVLYKTLRNFFPSAEFHTAYEAGYFGFHAHRKLLSLGIKSMVVDAGSLSQSPKDKERKSDMIDAKRLAEDLRDGRLRPIFIPSPKQEAFRKLSRTREDLVSSQTSTKNKIKSTLTRLGILVPKNHEMQHWSGRFLQWLKTEVRFEEQAEKFAFDVLLDILNFFRTKIAHVLRELKNLIRQDCDANRIVFEYIKSVPGVGYITAIALYAELMDMKRFRTGDDVKSYTGLRPSVQSSDKKVIIGGLTKRRNRHLRYLLVEAAWTAVRNDGAMAEAFYELCKRMKKTEAIIRIAKKLILRIRAVWLNEETYVFGLIE